jgi:hypothetical protein
MDVDGCGWIAPTPFDDIAILLANYSAYNILLRIKAKANYKGRCSYGGHFISGRSEVRKDAYAVHELPFIVPFFLVT